jgi:DnaJ-class molecular chaperone
MINYYQILDAKKTNNKDIILKKYNKKILKYKNLPFLNSEQREEVRNLKVALYILSNMELKMLYDNYLDIQNNKVKSSDINNIQNLEINQNDNINLSDNIHDKYTSLKKLETKDKDKNNQYLTDRLFSIKVNQNLNYENEVKLRS